MGKEKSLFVVVFYSVQKGRLVKKDEAAHSVRDTLASAKSSLRSVRGGGGTETATIPPCRGVGRSKIPITLINIFLLHEYKKR